MEMFEVGGCVRDELMGVESSDIDFTVVLAPGETERFNHTDPFKYMEGVLESDGFKIFLSTPEFLTVRAQFPSGDGGFGVHRVGGPINAGKKRLTADFVLARKEGTYTDGRRPDKVEVGTLEDDLRRRDFTMNAIAKDADGNLIDPFNGQKDIADKVIRCVGNPVDRFTEDALRAVRALRFSVTKGFEIMPSVANAMESDEVNYMIASRISDERIQLELSKMFRFDTVRSLQALNEFPSLTRAMFAGNVSLDATMKTKGRGR